MPEENKVKSIHGYSLFYDVEDKELQARNRGVTMTNIIEDNINPDGSGLMTRQGLRQTLEYWEMVPEEERADAYAFCKTELAERKLIAGGL